jgi:hypothetical protein
VAQALQAHQFLPKLMRRISFCGHSGANEEHSIARFPPDQSA